MLEMNKILHLSENTLLDLRSAANVKHLRDPLIFRFFPCFILV